MSQSLQLWGCTPTLALAPQAVDAVVTEGLGPVPWGSLSAGPLSQGLEGGLSGAGLGYGGQAGLPRCCSEAHPESQVLRAWVSRTPSLPPWVLEGAGGSRRCPAGGCSCPWCEPPLHPGLTQLQYCGLPGSENPPGRGSCPTEPHGCPLLGPGSRGAAAGASAPLMDGAPWGLLGAAGGGAGGFVCCWRRCRELASARASAAPHRPEAAPRHPPRTALEPSTAGTEALGTSTALSPRVLREPTEPGRDLPGRSRAGGEDAALPSEPLATSIPRSRRQLARHAPQPQVPGSGWHGRPGQGSPARGTGRERSAGIHSLRSREPGGFLCGLGFVCAGAGMNGPFSLCRHVCRGSPCAGQASNKRSRRGAARRGLRAAPTALLPLRLRAWAGGTAAHGCTARAWAHTHTRPVLGVLTRAHLVCPAVQLRAHPRVSALCPLYTPCRSPVHPL